MHDSGFSKQTQLSQVLHLSQWELWCGVVAAAAARGKSRWVPLLAALDRGPAHVGLSQRRVPPVPGPSDYHLTHGRPHGSTSSRFKPLSGRSSADAIYRSRL